MSKIHPKKAGKFQLIYCPVLLAFTGCGLLDTLIISQPYAKAKGGISSTGVDPLPPER